MSRKKENKGKMTTIKIFDIKKTKFSYAQKFSEK